MESDTIHGIQAEAEAQAESNAQPDVVTFRTRSETDNLDDGFSWKKYGQKNIKGRRYPRFYYKCRREGCPVKKRSERCEIDPQVVITTYYRKHNHQPNSASPLSTATRNSYDLRTQLLQSSNDS